MTKLNDKYIEIVKESLMDNFARSLDELPLFTRDDFRKAFADFHTIERTKKREASKLKKLEKTIRQKEAQIDKLNHSIKYLTETAARLQEEDVGKVEYGEDAVGKFILHCGAKIYFQD